MQKILFLALLLIAPIWCEIWKDAEGSVHGTGQLLCNGKPYANEKIQIWKKNKIRWDQLMFDVTTDNHGYFSMKASTKDWWRVDPYIYIPNYCGAPVNSGKQCTRSVVRVHFPDHYIHDGHLPTHVFNLGKLEMMGEKKTDLRGLGAYMWAERECRYI